jgi:hypothetical protein
MGGEALGPVKVPCSSIGKFKGQEVRVGGGGGGGDRGFLEGRLRKGITFGM